MGPPNSPAWVKLCPRTAAAVTLPPSSIPRSTGDPMGARAPAGPIRQHRMVADVPCTHSLELGLPPPHSHEALDWEHPDRDGFSPGRCFKFVVNPYLFGLIIAGSPPVVPAVLQ